LCERQLPGGERGQGRTWICGLYFYPENPADTGIILELKVDHTADEAVQQIIDKKYSLRFSGKAGEKAKYTGEILAVGIGYNKKTKKHQCRVITLRKDTLY
jgi:hypothetical protein